MSKSVQWLFIVLVLVLPSVIPAQEWVARYDGPDNGWDGGNAITVDSDGNVYVTGSSNGVGTLYDYATIKYSSSGIEQWVVRYNGPGNGCDEATAIAVDYAGNVYVTGYSEGPGTGSDYATIKYNPSGVMQWVARYSGPGNMADNAGGIALDDSGNVYIAGFSVGLGTGSDYATIKYSNSGVEQWVARYNGPASSHDAAIALVLDHTGNVYVAGTSQGSDTDVDYVTVKYNSSGVEQWVARYNGPANGRDGARAMAIDSSGNIYVTGSSVGIGTDNDYATVKYDPLGVEQWVVRYNGPANHWDDASAIGVDHMGNICVTGRSVDSDLEDDYATIKYSSSGAEQWVARYDGPADSYDDARAMVVDNAGNTYVTGYSIDLATHEDYATVKYSASGIEQWVARYNGPLDRCDDATAITVDNAGYVYVTGWSRGLEIGFDYATVKYSCTGVEEIEAPTEQMQATLTTSPNPFSNSTRIRYSILDTRYLKQTPTIRIYDSGGRLVKSFDHLSSIENQVSSISWSGIDDADRKLGSGIYFIELRAGDYVATEKIMLIR
jgi:uncharacterized delta-60 repeat protein